MHHQYDKSSKWLIQHYGDSILRLAGVRDFLAWRIRKRSRMRFGVAAGSAGRWRLVSADTSGSRSNAAGAARGTSTRVCVMVARVQTVRRLELRTSRNR